MNRTGRWIVQIFMAVVLCCSAARSYGQGARLQLANLDKLSDKAARVTDVTLDGSLLELAVKIIELDNDPEAAQLKDIIRSLKGIYVKSFEFDNASQYSPADVEAIRSQLTSPRWSKIVQSVDKRSHEHDEVYILKEGERVGGVVVLVAEARELTVVNIVGDVPLEKVMALENHFVPDGRHDSKHKPNKERNHDEE
ncbi:MAG TPA: DUF4252 domain-containing protein [Verrucomicrobiae bacterium]|nr:DUF4252 domain-containing protein [Verrucomicrobiae bacterium]